MNLKSIASLVPTIGNVVGGLMNQFLKSGNNGPMAKYSIYLTGDVKKGDVCFYIDSDTKQLSVANESEDRVCISFPFQNGNTVNSFFLAPHKTVELDSAFTSCVNSDVDAFNVSGISENSKTASANGSDAVSMSANGIIPVDSQSHPLDSYTSVSVSTDSIKLVQANYSDTKADIVDLYVRSTGGSESYATHNLEFGSDGTLTIDHPLMLKGAENIMISATLQYTPNNMAKFMKEN
ncbi:MAG: hypothetical protein LKI53_08850, partial [Bacteroidales bacterium]|nr:hypothetical protein [Bacteroidales bacterium]